MKIDLQNITLSFEFDFQPMKSTRICSTIFTLFAIYMFRLMMVVHHTALRVKTQVLPLEILLRKEKNRLHKSTKGMETPHYPLQGILPAMNLSWSVSLGCIMRWWTTAGANVWEGIAGKKHYNHLTNELLLFLAAQHIHQQTTKTDATKAPEFSIRRNGKGRLLWKAVLINVTRR